MYTMQHKTVLIVQKVPAGSHCFEADRCSCGEKMDGLVRFSYSDNCISLDGLMLTGVSLHLQKDGVAFVNNRHLWRHYGIRLLIKYSLHEVAVIEHCCLCNNVRTYWGNFNRNSEVEIRVFEYRVRFLELLGLNRFMTLGHASLMITKPMLRCGLLP